MIRSVPPRKATRRFNPRLAKINFSYTVEEIADLYRVHRNAVRGWIRRGLPICDKKRPMLVRGLDLREFLEARRKKNKRPLQPGEIYCVGCREPKRPAGDMADYQPLAETVGNLIGICPDCGALIYRRVNLSKLELVRGDLQIGILVSRATQGESRISSCDQPSVNSDLR